MKFPSLFRTSKEKQLFAYVFLLLGIICVCYSSLGALNLHGENEAIITSSTKDATVKISPIDITVEKDLVGSVRIKITTESNLNFSHIAVNMVSDGTETVLLNCSFSSRDYYVAYVEIPVGTNGSNTILQVYVSGLGLFRAPLTIRPGDTGFYMEIALFSGTGFLSAFFFLVNIRREDFLFMIPMFIALSVLFGERYDDYFMISSGMLVLQHVNPYIVSKNLELSLQWEYPPGFVPWSAFTSFLYEALFHSVLPSTSALNYIGVVNGAVYSAWRSLSGTNLYFLYGMVKLPMVLSFFWVGLNLRKLTSMTQWKLWLLNPLAIIVGILWGQLDVLALAFLLQALVYHRSGKGFLSILFACMGGAIKVFPFLIIPLLLFRSKNRKMAALGIVPVALFILLMYYISGNVANDISTLLVGRSLPVELGSFRSQGLTWQLVISYFKARTFPSLFLYAFIPFYAIFTAYSAWRNVELETYFVPVMLVFMLTYNFANPQYLIWLMPFLILKGEKLEAAVLSILGCLYVLFTYSYPYFLNPDLSWNYFSSLLGEMEQIRLAFTNSAAFLMIFGTISSFIFLLILIFFMRRQVVNCTYSSNHDII